MNKNFFIKDPIHGLIAFDEEYQWAVELIETKEFWRLNKIKQLGNAWTIYPAATHTRYSHSIGVFEITRKIVNHIKFVNSDIDNLQNDKKIVCAAALLHDIGHGPYSHAFEEATNYNHEDMSRLIITSNKTEINKVLIKNNIDPQAVADVIDHKAPKKWMHQIISSQIDADRLDYLQRDSHFTGAKFGIVDYDFLFSNSMVYENELYFSKYSWNIIENILIARWSMFENVYHNKISFTYDILMEKILRRVFYLINHNKKYRFRKESKHLLSLFSCWLKKEEWSVAAINQIDDSTFDVLIKTLSFENDHILKKLTKNWLKNTEFITYEKNNDEHLLLDDVVKTNKVYYYKSFSDHKKRIYDNTDSIMLYSTKSKNDSQEFKFYKLEEKSHVFNSLINSKIKPKIKKFIFCLKALKY